MVFALVPPTAADQDDPRLDDLFAALKSADSVENALAIEGQIWRIWLEFPEEGDAKYLMRDGTEAMSDGRFADALEAFDKVTRLAPDYAEGWNKRATVLYLLGDHQRSVEDIQRTLALEDRHFGALAGLG